MLTYAALAVLCRKCPNREWAALFYTLATWTSDNIIVGKEARRAVLKGAWGLPMSMEDMKALDGCRPLKRIHHAETRNKMSKLDRVRAGIVPANPGGVYVGRSVCKLFKKNGRDRWYDGVVTVWDPYSNRDDPKYKVVYGDDDTEDLTQVEVADILEPQRLGGELALVGKRLERGGVGGEVMNYWGKRYRVRFDDGRIERLTLHDLNPLLTEPPLLLGPDRVYVPSAFPPATCHLLWHLFCVSATCVNPAGVDAVAGIRQLLAHGSDFECEAVQGFLRDIEDAEPETYPTSELYVANQVCTRHSSSTLQFFAGHEVYKVSSFCTSFLAGENRAVVLLPARSARDAAL